MLPFKANARCGGGGPIRTPQLSPRSFWTLFFSPRYYHRPISHFPSPMPFLSRLSTSVAPLFLFSPSFFPSVGPTSLLPLPLPLPRPLGLLSQPPTALILHLSYLVHCPCGDACLYGARKDKSKQALMLVPCQEGHRSCHVNTQASSLFPPSLRFSPGPPSLLHLRFSVPSPPTPPSPTTSLSAFLYSLSLPPTLVPTSRHFPPLPTLLPSASLPSFSPPSLPLLMTWRVRSKRATGA